MNKQFYCFNKTLLFIGTLGQLTVTKFKLTKQNSIMTKFETGYKIIYLGIVIRFSYKYVYLSNYCGPLFITESLCYA